MILHMNSLRSMLIPVVAAAFCASAETGRDDCMTYFSCGFESGMPSLTAVYDEDGHELHFTMVQSGFESRDSWRCLREEGTDNYFAASASRFKAVDGKSPGPASDWMVLPPVWIRGGDATLNWESRSFNDQSSRPSTYNVYVSTSGPEPSSFAQPPVAVITEDEMDEWAEHSADLGAFENQRVYIAFVNTSSEAEILGIDNVSVEGRKGLAEIEVTPGKYALGPEQAFKIGGTLTAYSDVPVTSLSVECEVAGKKWKEEYKDLDLKCHESFSFSFPEEVQANFGETVPFKVIATVNSTVFDPIECSTTVLSFLPSRKVVIEEATGMWCQYCPKGIYAFDVLQEKYPDTFIGIAVHMMAEMDPMALDNYANRTNFTGGAPSGWIDRKWYSLDPVVPVWEDSRRVYTTLMGGFETLFLQRMAEQPLAEVSLAASVPNASELEVNATTRFPVNSENADCRLAVVVTEDHVWKQGYFQYNVFSGSNETIGGFESRPNIIRDDMEFNHVARVIYDDYNGIPQSLPSSIKAGEEYVFSRKFKLPDSILDFANIKVIAMVIDNSTGEIMNATSVKPALAGVGETVAEGGCVVERAGDALTVKSGDAGENIRVSLYDVAGRLVGEGSGQGEVVLDVSGLRGMCVLRTESQAGIQARKIVM